MSLLRRRPKVPTVLAYDEVDLAHQAPPVDRKKELACGVKTRMRAIQNLVSVSISDQHWIMVGDGIARIRVEM